MQIYEHFAKPPKNILPTPLTIHHFTIHHLRVSEKHDLMKKIASLRDAYR